MTLIIFRIIEFLEAEDSALEEETNLDAPILCACCGNSYNNLIDLKSHLEKVSQQHNKLNKREPLENYLMAGELELLEKVVSEDSASFTLLPAS